MCANASNTFLYSIMSYVYWTLYAKQDIYFKTLTFNTSLMKKVRGVSTSGSDDNEAFYTDSGHLAIYFLVAWVQTLETYFFIHIIYSSIFCCYFVEKPSRTSLFLYDTNPYHHGRHLSCL